MKTRMLSFTAFLVAVIAVAISFFQNSASQETGAFSEFPGKVVSGKPPGKLVLDEPVQVWCSVDFIQLDRKDIEEVEKNLGFPLDPIDGKVVLDSGERKKLMAAIDKAQSVDYLGSASVLAIPGQCAQSKLVEEVRYWEETLEYEEVEEDGKTVTKRVPEKGIETREIGILLSATANIHTDSEVITLVLFPEMSLFHGWINFPGDSFSQPIFSSWNMATTWYIEDGSTIVTKGMPGKAFQESHVLNPKLKTEKRAPKVSLIIGTAKLVRVGESSGGAK